MYVSLLKIVSLLARVVDSAAYILLDGSQDFMLVPAEEDFLAAVEKLEAAGGRRTLWSYGTVNPDVLDTNPMAMKIHGTRIQQFERFGQHSVQFQLNSHPPSTSAGRSS